MCVQTVRPIFQDLTLKELRLFEMGSFCGMSLLLLLIHFLIIFEETYISKVFNSNNQTNNLHKNQTICLSVYIL